MAKQELSFQQIMGLPLKSEHVTKNAIRKGVYALKDNLMAQAPRGKDDEKTITRAVEVALGEIDRINRTNASAAKSLNACTAGSICNAIRAAIQDGLLIDGKLAYFVPYGNEASYTPSWMGLIAIARNAGIIKGARAETVYSNEPFTFEEHNGKQSLSHSRFLQNRGDRVGVYCAITLPDDSTVYNVCDQVELAMIRSKTKSQNSPAYRDFDDEMAKKSTVRRGLKPWADDANLSSAFSHMDREFEQILERQPEMRRDQTRTAALAASLANQTTDSFATPVQQESTPSSEPAQKPRQKKTPAKPKVDLRDCPKCNEKKCARMDEADGDVVLICTSCGEFTPVETVSETTTLPGMEA